MKSELLGRTTLEVEVTDISRHGLRLLVDEEELFMPFDEFPWFKEASVSAILNVGYRVRSHRGTQFRQWATARLSELLVKGFTLDDERIKAGRTIAQDHLNELLERIRDAERIVGKEV